MSIVEQGGRLAYDERPEYGSVSTESALLDAVWNRFVPCAYECRVYLLPENEGFSIWMADLPGVASQGDTEAEAIEHLKEAFLAVLEVYQEDGMEVPWLPKPKTRPADATERWILVNA